MTNGNAQGSPGEANQAQTAEGPPLKSSGARLKPGDRNQLGIYFVCLTALTLYILIATWPSIDPNFPTRLNQPRILGFALKATADERLFITVATAGALGSLIHTITSFGDYVGNRELAQSWVWYLILRTPVGIALALLFCITLRAGLIAPSLPEDFATTHPLSLLNPYGFAAIGALAGMFSKTGDRQAARDFQLAVQGQPASRSRQSAQPSVARYLENGPLRADGRRRNRARGHRPQFQQGLHRVDQRQAARSEMGERHAGYGRLAPRGRFGRRPIAGDRAQSGRRGRRFRAISR